MCARQRCGPLAQCPVLFRTLAHTLHRTQAIQFLYMFAQFSSNPKSIASQSLLGYRRTFRCDPCDKRIPCCMWMCVRCTSLWPCLCVRAICDRHLSIPSALALCGAALRTRDSPSLGHLRVCLCECFVFITACCCWLLFLSFSVALAARIHTFMIYTFTVQRRS